MKADCPKLLRRVLAYFLLACVLLSTPATSTYGVIQTCNPTGYFGACVDASPGKYSRKLGVDFPTFASVKLSYPSSSILVNSVGDLLFNVTLNPLMLNPLSAQVSNSVLPSPQVRVRGSGFSSSDTTCSLSGSPVGTIIDACTISGGILTVSFNVADVPAGVYTITATGIPGGDFLTSTFTVLPPSLFLNPSSGPVGVTVGVSGFGFYTTDTTCTITSNGALIVAPIACTLTGGTIDPGFSFTVPAVPTGTYTVTVTGNTNGDLATATFTVTSTSQYITLNPLWGSTGTLVTMAGSGFANPTDTSCSISGSGGIVTSPGGCTIAIGTITVPGAFIVDNVRAGVYTITVTGNPGADSAAANFQVLPSPPSVPISVPISIDIYVPPDFTGLAISKTWTSFSNNYDPNLISLSRQSSDDQIGPNWWRISVSNLTVTNSPSSYSIPLVGHRIFVVGQSQYIRLFQVTSPSTAGRYFFKAFINGKSIGAPNFPTLVVKGSRDPAYISGVLRDAGNTNPYLAGTPINLIDRSGTPLGARVLATGIDYLGRPASAQAFLNSTANGNYTLFGVAPGTYNITAYAAGYLPTTTSTTISVGAGQSLVGLDILLPHSVNMTLSVLSMTADGIPIPWGTLSAISPSGAVTTRQRSISFQLIPLSGASTIDTTSSPLIPLANQFNISLSHYLLDGRVPQDFATDTSGFIAGDYYLRAYVLSYVQIDDALIHVSNQTIHIRSEIRLLRSSILSVTVHFKDSNSTIGEVPLAMSGTLSINVYDQQWILRGQNTTFVAAGQRHANLTVVGLSRSRTFGTVSRFSHDYGLLPGTYHVFAQLKSSPIYSGFANIGVRDLYFQLADIQVTLGLASSASFNIPTQISFAMIRGGGIDMTFYSVDTQKPTVLRPFTFPGKTITLNIIDPYGNVYYSNATQPFNNATVQFFYAGLLTNDYTIFVKTIGYTQRDTIKVHVVLGGNSDISVWLVQDPVIDLTLVFKTEGLLSPIDSTLPFAQPLNHIDATPARFEVYDTTGNFMGANLTYIPNGDRTFEITLAGFNRYFGDPMQTWSGFYDATDSSRQVEGGLSPGNYMVLVWVEGYYQYRPIQVTLQLSQNVSLVVSMNRGTRVSGVVVGPDMFDKARPLSWATIDMEPRTLQSRYGNYTTFSLDGRYQLWVPGGSYDIGVSLAGYQTATSHFAVPPGSDLTANFWLDDYQPSPMAITYPPLAPIALALITVNCTIPSLDLRSELLHCIDSLRHYCIRRRLQKDGTA